MHIDTSMHNVSIWFLSYICAKKLSFFLHPPSAVMMNIKGRPHVKMTDQSLFRWRSESLSSRYTLKRYLEFHGTGLLLGRIFFFFRQRRRRAFLAFAQRIEKLRRGSRRRRTKAGSGDTRHGTCIRCPRDARAHA